MNGPANSRGLRKGARDLVQSVVAVLAAGGAAAVIQLVVDNVNPAYGVLLAFVFKILITYAQNYLETAGKIPVLLPTAAIGSGAGETVAAEGDVDTMDSAGEVSEGEDENPS